MKKLKIILSISLIIVFVSCEKQLEIKPISQLSVDNFYNSLNDFEQGINGAYSSLKDYPLWILRLSETRSDNIYAVNVRRDWGAISDFQSTISDIQFIENTWDQIYAGLLRTNSALEQLDNGVITDTSVKNRMEGELLFLRGFYHFTLLRFFGGVPIVGNSLTSEQAFDLPRNTVTEVYESVIADLEQALVLLPENAPKVGKATKDATRGILAYVYITRSGPKHGIDGPGQESNNYDKVIELVNQIKSRQMITNYSDIFSYDNENNSDIIFDVQLFADTGLGNSYPGDLVGEAYWRSLGAPGGLSGQPQDVNVSDDLYNSYDPLDLRKDLTIQSGYVESDIFKDINVFVKFIDKTRIPVNSDWGINFPVVRYTDLLLLKAEAILNGGAPGSQSDVDDIVNDVRSRAGLAPLSGVTFNQLMDERRKEFAGEGLRWFDLVRTPDVVSEMNAWIVEEDATGSMEVMTTNYIIYPIPQDEIDVSLDLYKQNPGY